ncbi:hypothetical protein [Commensalibacter nepenthis]|uniref:Uncharacterized protein n=1 Tax=Commensalibacter nepenthis TaxID=3043872 RepID=A0ABT6Q5T0_9PROT|nr:hypothetical protein [Commensalibacter sp. TBRC 10068]MDI2112117.1 hypothetical protein [Commensalibacter sp. TBRC 10068]
MKNFLSPISILGSYATVAVLTVGTMVGFSYSAHAAEGKACYEQFSAAKKANTLKEKNFKEFKAANCDQKAAIPADKPAANAAKADKPANEAKEPVKKDAVEKAPVVSGDVVFPDKIDPQFASEKEGTARMNTCKKQYHLNKTSNKNGGLKWIQKGGGYYSECNKHLKSATGK